MANKYRIGVDIGGTFTDFTFVDDVTGEVFVDKRLTTPEQPDRAVHEGITGYRAVRKDAVEGAGAIIHATTLLTNVVLERKGALTGLLTTYGFRDILEFGRELRYDVYDAFIEFPLPLVEFRHRHPHFRRRRWVQGRPIRGRVGEGIAPDIAWLRPDGQEMTDDDWDNTLARSLGVFLNGDAIRTPDPQGRAVIDESFLVISNAWWDPLDWVLPGAPYGTTWERVIDTATGWVVPDAEPREVVDPVSGTVNVLGRSLLVLRRIRPEENDR